MFQDNAPLMVRIDKEHVDFYKTSKILGTDNNKIGHKEQFLISLSLGFKLGSTKKVENPDPSGFFRTAYLKDHEEALIYAIAIKHHKDVKDIGSVADVYNLAEEYANAGVQVIKDLEKNSSYDNYFMKFEKLISNDLKEIYSGDD